MANEEHCQLLKSSVVVWNAWRRENPDCVPDLSGADFSQCDLSHADLRFANCYQTNFSKATLESAILYQANLNEADLRKSHAMNTNLRFATLYYAKLTDSDMSGADLSHISAYDVNATNARFDKANFTCAQIKVAWIADASFRGADLGAASFSAIFLGGSDFAEARMRDTSFYLSNLGSVTGLDTVVHEGRSEICPHSMFQRALPLKFLQGIGLSDLAIEMLKLDDPKISSTGFDEVMNKIRLLRNRLGLQLSSVFISYAEADRAFAEKLHAALQSRGVRCWFAASDLKMGEKTLDQISNAIRSHDRVLLVLSRNSIQRNWVDREIKLARSREENEGENVLFPIMIDSFEEVAKWQSIQHDGSDLAEAIRDYFIGDFTQWEDETMFSSKLDQLVQGLIKSSTSVSQTETVRESNVPM